MAAPVYSTDLTDINLAESTTGWAALGGGGAGLSVEPDFFIQGNNCIAKQVKNELKGHHYNNGATAQGTDDHVYVWIYVSTPGTTDLLTNGGLRVTLGTGTNARKEYYVAGNDTYFRGGWVCYPIRYSLTPDNAVGSAGATPSFFGSVMNGTVSVKAPNLGVDAIRYGSNVSITDGVGQPATFTGLAQFADNLTRSWGLIQEVGGGVQVQGKVLIGTGAAQCEFSESNILVLFPDNNPSAVNQHTLIGHKEIIIDNASSVVTWDGITFLSLDATDKGVITVNTSSSTTITGSVFQNIATTSLHSSVSVTGSTWINCESITANQATFTACTFNGIISASSVITDDLADLDDCTFVSDGSNYAVELTSVGTGSMNWNCTATGYVAGSTGSPASTSSTGNEAIFVNVASGTLTINVASGATVPSIRTAGATVNVVAGQVTFTIVVKDIDTNAVIPDARVYVVADTGGNLTAGTVLIDKINTDVNGEVSATVSLTADQPFVGSVRRATPSLGDGTLYKPASPAGTISSAADSSLTVQLIKDQ
jgi:hypothetical protein